MNQDGYFEFRAEKTGSETTLSGIIDLVRTTLGTKAPIARLADRVCAVFVPIVIFLALAAGIYQLVTGSSVFTAVSTAAAVLVISCPCALGLAAPLAIAAGTNRAALDGILVKSAAAFETLNKIDTVILDKTGTVTEGKPKLIEIISRIPGKENDLLENIGALEFCSDHPLARAVRDHLKNKGLRLTPGSDFETIPGRGIRGMINGREFLAGSETLMKESKIDLSEWQETIDHYYQRGSTVLLAASNGQFQGLLVFDDPPRPECFEAIQEFKKLGLEIVLLSGDNKRTVEAAARAIGIIPDQENDSSSNGQKQYENVFAEVLPADKERIVRSIQENGLPRFGGSNRSDSNVFGPSGPDSPKPIKRKNVAMIGDGINDAPALVRADLGIAISTGTDIALDSADIILTGGDLRSAVRAFRSGRRVVRVIKENFFWAFVYNAVCIPLAAGIFYPIFGWRLSPVAAAAAMGFSSLCVVLNSVRLQRKI